MDVKSASILLQHQMLRSYTQQTEESKLEIPTEKCKRRADLVQSYLDQMGKLQTYEDATKLTKLLLSRYKGTLGSERANAEDAYRSKNLILKKGTKILSQRYSSLCQMYQEEQRKSEEMEKRLKQTVSEINYYKETACALMNKLKDLNARGTNH